MSIWSVTIVIIFYGWLQYYCNKNLTDSITAGEAWFNEKESNKGKFSSRLNFLFFHGFGHSAAFPS